MNQLKALIIDDETNARMVIRGMLEENVSEIQIVGEAKDLPQGVKLIHQLKPDIVFLDIEMPQYSGLEILDFFDPNAIDFHLIFVTAYNKYALDAFRLSAIDYLVKPIQLNELNRAIKKIEKLSPQNFETLKSNLNNEKAQKIIVNSSGAQIVLDIDEIIYIRADGSYSDIIMIDGTKHCITKKLIEFEVLSEANDFVRVHRSHIINIKHVQKFFKSDGGGVVMCNGDELSISKEKRDDLEQKLTYLRI